MINIKTKYDCCGCGGCKQACPLNCIKMEPDQEGFLYPVVDTNICINCHICEQVCPIKKSDNCMIENIQLTNIAVYGGWHKDNKVRFTSSSGGAFTLFAEYILVQGGKVYGCTLDNNMKAIHIGISQIEDLYKLKGSKYIQSDIGTVYAEIKESIRNNQKVLFVGTPCQAAGLYSYLGKKNKNLYIVDFICHGVPSPTVFDAYIKKMETKYKSKIISYKFRNKDRGWTPTGLQLGSKIEFSNGLTIRKYPAFKDSFMNGFLDDLYLRPSCYHCKFKELPKNYADITIADFWGANKVSKILNDRKGTSLILLHTNHAKNLWKKVNEKVYFEKIELDKAIKRNKSLLYSAKENSKRDNFFKDFKENGYTFVEKKYLSTITWIVHKIIHIVTK